MKTGDLGKGAATVALVMVGVIGAGWVMSQFKGSVGFISQAHSGYDS